jgi:hypothetical protein
MPTITLPHNFKLRPYQKPLWNYLEAGAIAAWHRRAGKDQVTLNWMACAALLVPTPRNQYGPQKYLGHGG